MTAKDLIWKTSLNIGRQWKNSSKLAIEKWRQGNDLPFVTAIFSNTAPWKKQSRLNRKKTICL